MRKTKNKEVKAKYNWRKHLKSNKENVQTIISPQGVAELEKVLALGRKNMQTLRKSMKYMDLNLFILEKIIENGKVEVVENN